MFGNGQRDGALSFRRIEDAAQAAALLLEVMKVGYAIYAMRLGGGRRKPLKPLKTIKPIKHQHSRFGFLSSLYSKRMYDIGRCGACQLILFVCHLYEFVNANDHTPELSTA